MLTCDSPKLPSRPWSTAAGADQSGGRPTPQPGPCVSFVDLARQHRPLRSALLEAVGQVIDGAQFILGNQVEQFEEAFARLCGTRFAVAVNSGTDALVLSLRALGIGPGDEVITVPNSFIATASAIVLTGATPVFVDVGPDSNMDPAQIPGAITPRTKALIPVHLTGRPADMDRILQVATAQGLHVVEDAAQAVTAEYRGRRVGSLGACGAFSLHPLKTLGGCGDGGIVTTSDPGVAQRLKELRNLGLRTRDDCVAWGPNSRLDTVQAAMLLVKLKHLETWTEARRRHAAFYRESLSDLPGVRVPAEQAYERAVYHTFVIQAERRDALKQYLSDRGIQTAVHYPIPIHLQSVGRQLGYSRGMFPHAEEQCGRILSLPVSAELDHEQLQYVVAVIRAFYGT